MQEPLSFQSEEHTESEFKRDGLKGCTQIWLVIHVEIACKLEVIEGSNCNHGLCEDEQLVISIKAP